jgi:glycosyltransferase involved in cell wall biosynthesis
VSRRTVLFVTPWYPTSDQPTSGVFVREHARAAAISSNVAVLHLAGSANRMRLEEVSDPSLTAGIPTWRLRHRALALTRTDVIAQTWALNRSLTWLKKRAGIDPHLIHAHVFLAGAPSVIVGKIRRLPVVISEHYSAFPLRSLARHDLFKARIAFRLADRVLPVSQMLKEAIETHGIKGNFVVVPNVVDTTLFHPPEVMPLGPPTFLYVGHLYEDKGIGDLLNALGNAGLQTQNWSLVVIGEGSQEPWRALAEQAGIAERVCFVGPLKKNEVAEWMRKASALIIPSWLETQSVVFLEAMACGLPVFATDLPAITESMFEGGVVRFPPRDTDNLARQLLNFLESDCVFPESAEIARSAHEKFSAEKVGQTLDSLYQEVRAARIKGATKARSCPQDG